MARDRNRSHPVGAAYAVFFLAGKRGAKEQKTEDRKQNPKP
jgi:hypothetical protein